MSRVLVERAQQGDRDAYEQLARGIARSLYLVATRVLRDWHPHSGVLDMDNDHSAPLLRQLRGVGRQLTGGWPSLSRTSVPPQTAATQ